MYALTFGDYVGAWLYHLCHNTYRFVVNLLKFSLTCSFVLLCLLLELLQSEMNDCIFYVYASPVKRICILSFSHYHSIVSVI